MAPKSIGVSTTQLGLDLGGQAPGAVPQAPVAVQQAANALLLDN
ncbi:hypothetical protein ACFYXD_15760 [Streptomyces platensis]